MAKTQKFFPSLGETLIAVSIYAALAIICSPFPGLGDSTRLPLLDPAGVLQVFPWVSFNLAELQSGYFPLWNHLTGAGQPHLANIQTAVFFPLYWAWQFAGGSESSYGLMLLSRLFLAALFWFLFARRAVCGFIGALAAGAIYGFGAYALWFSQLIDLNSQMLLPLLLLTMPPLMVRPRLNHLIGTALIMALAVLGGHPEAALNTIVVAVLYSWASWSVRPDRPSLCKGVVLVGLSALLAFFLAAAVVLPFLNYFSRSWSLHGPGFGFFHLDPRAIYSLVVSGAHTLISDTPATIPVEHLHKGPLEMLGLPYHETSVPGSLPTAGVLVSALALAAAFRFKRLPWQTAFFCALAIILLGVTLGLPGFRLLALIPPYNTFSNFKFFFSEVQACLALLAGMGLERVLSKLGVSGSARGNPALMAILVVAAVAVTFHLRNLAGFSPMAAVAIFLALSAAAVLARRQARAILPISIFVILYMGSQYVSPFIHLEIPAPAQEAAIVRAVQERCGDGRISGLADYLPPNRAMLAGVKDLRSSDALFFEPYVRALNRVNRLDQNHALSFFYPAYYMRPTARALFVHESANLAAACVLSPYPQLIPSISQEVAVKATRSIGRVKPAADYFSPTGANNVGKVPSLFMHAPASLDFSGREYGAGELSFLPALPCCPPKGDGVFFLTIMSGRLEYARYLAGGLPSFDLDTPVLIGAGKSETVTLATLPGPKNDSGWDQARFAALFWQDKGYSRLKPSWSAGEEGPYLYDLHADPWAEGRFGESLSVKRESGGEFEVSASGSGRVLIREAYYPGWRAFTGGREVKIFPADDLVSWRIDIPDGRGALHLRFLPADFRIGLFLSLAALLVSLLMPTIASFQEGAGKRK